MPSPSGAFQAQGNTSLIPATTTATAAIQPSTGSIPGCMLTNLSTNAIWVAIGQSSTMAVAALPTTSVPANGIPMLAGSAQTLGAPPNFWISAITGSTGTSQLAVTPGLGL
jgi:hypothetical protein